MPSGAFPLLLVGEHLGKKPGLASWTGYVKRIRGALPDSVSASTGPQKQMEVRPREDMLPEPAYTASTRNPSWLNISMTATKVTQQGHTSNRVRVASTHSHLRVTMVVGGPRVATPFKVVLI